MKTTSSTARYRWWAIIPSLLLPTFLGRTGSVTNSSNIWTPRITVQMELQRSLQSELCTSPHILPKPRLKPYNITLPIPSPKGQDLQTGSKNQPWDILGFCTKNPVVRNTQQQHERGGESSSFLSPICAAARELQLESVNKREDSTYAEETYWIIGFLSKK